MKIEINKIKDWFNPKVFYRNTLVFIAEKSHVIILLAFISLMGYSGFIWYDNVYNHQWTEKKKQDYIRSKDKNISFNINRFNEMIGEEEKRKEEYDKRIEGKGDFFRLKK